MLGWPCGGELLISGEEDTQVQGGQHHKRGTDTGPGAEGGGIHLWQQEPQLPPVLKGGCG